MKETRKNINRKEWKTEGKVGSKNANDIVASLSHAYSPRFHQTLSSI